VPAAELDAAAKGDQLPLEVKVLSPIAGTIVQRNVYEGQYVKEGDVLFEVADFSLMWFVFDAYERDLPWIRVGSEVEISVPALPGKTFQAPITFIDPNLSSDTRSAKIRVVLDNPLVKDPGKHRHELLHNLYAEGRIVSESAATLTVPRTAVLWPAGRPLVYVDKGNGQYEPREVQVAGSGDDVWEIAGGLTEGERVVTTGNLLLDGQAHIDHPAETSAPAPSAALTEAQQAAALDFFQAVAGLARALSSDDPAAFRTGAAKLAEPARALQAAFGARVADLAAATHLPDTADLAAQRAAFYPLSEATAQLALALRRESKGLEAVRVFACDMARGNVPSAARERGHWVQLNADLHNPWWGAEMPACGAEVRP
jgi:Cu(I)/Ag(I) efflux system membrane fusion protein